MVEKETNTVYHGMFTGVIRDAAISTTSWSLLRHGFLAHINRKLALSYAHETSRCIITYKGKSQ
jgi:hypothetical protein